MRDEVKERNATEDDERIGYFEAMAIDKSEKNQCGAEGHQEVEQRGWVFRAIQEGEKGEDCGMLVCPGSGVSVAIDGAEDKEGERRNDACCEDDLLPSCGLE